MLFFEKCARRDCDCHLKSLFLNKNKRFLGQLKMCSLGTLQ